VSGSSETSAVEPTSVTSSPDDRWALLDPTTPLDELRTAIDRLASELSTAWPSALESRDTEVLDRVVHASRALKDAAQVLRSSGWVGIVDPRDGLEGRCG
jgi:hypothetical protein